MDCVELLEQMVSIPSESQNEEAFARFLCSYLHDELGMESELQHIAGKSYIRSLGCVPRTSPSLTGFHHDGREASDGPAYPNTRHGAAATQQAAAPVFGEMVSEAWDIPLSPPPAPDKPPCCSSL